MKARCQAIIWTNVRILLIGPPGTNFSEILIEIHTFSFKKMRFKLSSGKGRPFCLGLNVLMAAASNHSHKYQWVVITCPCPWCILLAHHTWYIPQRSKCQSRIYVRTRTLASQKLSLSWHTTVPGHQQTHCWVQKLCMFRAQLRNVIGPDDAIRNYGRVGRKPYSIVYPGICVRTLLIFPWTKWPTFPRRHFQMLFREWKVWYFDSNFTEVCS